MSTEQTGEQTRRRRRHLPVALVAAAVVLAGGGGAYWASAASGGDTEAAAGSDGSAPPPLTLDDPGLTGPDRGEAAGTGSAGIAPGEPDPSGTRSYRASGNLPHGPDSAPVYRPGEVSRAEVAELAKALGMSAAPRQENGRWRAGGAQDGTGPVLTVGDEQARGTWSFSRHGPGAPACMKPLPAEGPARSERPKPSCPSQAPDGAGHTDGGPIARGEPVPEARAEQTVRKVLKPLGLEHAKLGPAGTQGALRLVTANAVVDGLPTLGWSSTFAVASDGALVRGHGRLGGLDQGATYPVQTAEQTLKALNDSRGGAPGVAPGEPDPSGGGKSASVTDARFSLATHFSHGDPLLVPSWSFTVERQDGRSTYTVGYPAVKPSLLRLPNAPKAPSPRPSAPTGHAKGQQTSSYTSDGRSLTLTFWGGVCDTYQAVARETPQKVTVSVRPAGHDKGRVCIEIAKRQTVKVTLDRPLGDRTVVDARNGEPLPVTAQK